MILESADVVIVPTGEVLNQKHLANATWISDPQKAGDSRCLKLLRFGALVCD